MLGLTKHLLRRRRRLLDKPSEFLMVEQRGWQLYRVAGSRTTDPERLDRVVSEPDLRVKEVHAAPIDQRSLSDGVKLPSAQETPVSRTSAGA